ncbi:MAG: hypothetical protein GY854_04470 [Deltaproteobacteria bacterium]|nr:hypothetical protein [Deltaproteobacteria bacterium]
MTNYNDDSLDFDPGPTDDLGVKDALMGALPQIPFPALPIPGVPMPWIPDLSFIFDFIGFITDFVDQVKSLDRLKDDMMFEGLAKAANSAGLEVDLDLDMDLGAVKKAIEKAAKEQGGAAAASIAGKLASAMDVDLTKFFSLPSLPIPPLPIPGVPMPWIPDLSFVFDFIGLVTDFIDQVKSFDAVKDDMMFDGLTKAANSAGLQVDFDLDMDIGAMKKAIEKAAEEQGGAAAASIAGKLASAMDVDLTKFFSLPSLPIPTLPIPGVPMPWIPDIAFILEMIQSLTEGSPTDKLASWLD